MQKQGICRPVDISELQFPASSPLAVLPKVLIIEQHLKGHKSPTFVLMACYISENSQAFLDFLEFFKSVTVAKNL